MCVHLHVCLCVWGVGEGGVDEVHPPLSHPFQDEEGITLLKCFYAVAPPGAAIVSAS